MSRIDEALRIAEAFRGAVTTAGNVVPSSDAAQLTQYRTEDRDSEGHDEPASAPAGEVLPSSRPIAVDHIAVQTAALPDSADLHARLVTSRSSSVALEQYRKLAAVLHEHQSQSQLKTVMITSALPRDGKTLTVVNVALTLSESYARRVLMIDADLRCPSLHTVLDLPNERGLNDALHENTLELQFAKGRSCLECAPR